MQHLEHASAAVVAFATAGASAIAALTGRVIGATVDLPVGLERLMDLGFAGVFIAALIYGIRIVWVSKLESDKKHDALEKEIRDGLIEDLKEASRTRNEMVQIMRRKETRDVE